MPSNVVFSVHISSGGVLYGILYFKLLFNRYCRLAITNYLKDFAMSSKGHNILVRLRSRPTGNLITRPLAKCSCCKNFVVGLDPEWQ